MKKIFKNKKITVVGIDPDGRGVQDAEFLASCGAEVVATDMKKESELKESVARLKKYKNISLVLGRHRRPDFKNKDIIIRPANISDEYSFIKEAKKNKIDIKTDETLFLKYAPEVLLVGITGTRGKSTTAHLVYEIIKNSGRRVFIAGNVRKQAALPLLKKVRKGDILVMELDSWKIQGFAAEKISPHIGVFTTFYQDHLNYYKGNIKKYFNDKAAIFKNQKKGDFLVVGESAKKAIKKYYKGKIKSKILEAAASDVPKLLKTNLLGEHNKENIAFAMKVCRLLGLSEKDIKNGVEKFKGVFGRLQLVRGFKGSKFYNDTTATSPDATVAALKALGSKSKNIILLAGGADKELDYKDFAKAVKKHVKLLILFKGIASDKITKELRIKNQELRVKHNSLFLIHSSGLKVAKDIDSMKEAVNLAMSEVKRKDIILLSPGAASFGLFKNEFDRGEMFCAIVKRLK